MQTLFGSADVSDLHAASPKLQHTLTTAVLGVAQQALIAGAPLADNVRLLSCAGRVVTPNI